MSSGMTNLGALRDPADLAEARRALERAERQAEADALARKLHLEAEAKRAAEAEFQAEIDARLGDSQPIIDAQAALEDLQALRAKIVAQADTGAAALARARGVLPALVARAVAGEAVTPAEVDRAYDGVASAERYRAFLTDVVAHLAPLIASAESALKAAIATAYVGVRQRGVELRLQAAREVVAASVMKPGVPMRSEDRERVLPGTSLDREAMVAARQTFDRANRFLNYAASKGVPMPPRGIPMDWPTEDITERGFWSHWGSVR